MAALGPLSANPDSPVLSANQPASPRTAVALNVCTSIVKWRLEAPRSRGDNDEAPRAPSRWLRTSWTVMTLLAATLMPRPPAMGQPRSAPSSAGPTEKACGSIQDGSSTSRRSALVVVSIGFEIGGPPQFREAAPHGRKHLLLGRHANCQVPPVDRLGASPRRPFPQGLHRSGTARPGGG